MLAEQQRELVEHTVGRLRGLKSAAGRWGAEARMILGEGSVGSREAIEGLLEREVVGAVLVSVER